MYVHLFNIWILLNSSWSPPLIDFGKHKNGQNSIIFTYIKLNLGLVIDEWNPKHILCEMQN